MKYRDAKKLVMGDLIVRKTDKKIFTVEGVENYGQYKKCKINCCLLPSLERAETIHITLYNDEIDYPEIEDSGIYSI